MADEPVADRALVALRHLLEREGVCADRCDHGTRLPGEPGGRRGDAARIHAAAQENAHPFSRADPCANRADEQLSKMLDVLVAATIHEAPVRIDLPVSCRAGP
jgi:hypothetical protein